MTKQPSSLTTADQIIHCRLLFGSSVRYLWTNNNLTEVLTTVRVDLLLPRWFIQAVECSANLNEEVRQGLRSFSVMCLCAAGVSHYMHHLLILSNIKPDTVPWFQYIDAASKYKQGEENSNKNINYIFSSTKCERKAKYPKVCSITYKYSSGERKAHKRENSMWMKMTELKYQRVASSGPGLA